MTAVTPAHVVLPLEMPPQLAQRLADILAGARRDTDLHRFLMLSLLYASWSESESFSLMVLYRRLKGMLVDSSFHLHEALTAPTLYTLKCQLKNISQSDLEATLKAVAELGESLKLKNLLHLRTRMLTLLREVFGESDAMAMLLAQEILLAIASVYDLDEEQTKGLLKSHGYLMDEALPPKCAPSFAPRLNLTERTAVQHSPAGLAASTPPAHHLTVFSPHEAQEQLRRLGDGNAAADQNSAQRRLLMRMAAEQGWRKVQQSPDIAELEVLYERFPHFSEVIDHVRCNLALSGAGEEGCPVRISPILLRGAPGTGKTYFAQELARLLNVPFVQRDLSVVSEAFVLTGMDAGWKNAKPGLIFDALVMGEYANPLICLDEVDKVRAGSVHNSPISPLYSLLEPTSAKAFTDEFVPVKLDARHIVWVLTANDGDIPEPILSRLEVFDIPAPTEEQCAMIAQSVWANLCETVLPKGHKFELELPADIIRSIQSQSPRQMRKALSRAAAQAAIEGRAYLLAKDLVGLERTPKRRSIGFHAHF
jgi:ATP-dependent Lon protease